MCLRALGNLNHRNQRYVFCFAGLAAAGIATACAVFFGIAAFALTATDPSPPHHHRPHHHRHRQGLTLLMFPALPVAGAWEVGQWNEILNDRLSKWLSVCFAWSFMSLPSFLYAPNSFNLCVCLNKLDYQCAPSEIVARLSEYGLLRGGGRGRGKWFQNANPSHRIFVLLVSRGLYTAGGRLDSALRNLSTLSTPVPPSVSKP
jgi:hypothetical protein